MRRFTTTAFRMSQAINQDKAALRKRIKAVLSSIGPSEIEAQSRQITEKVLKLPEYQNAKSISIFLSMPGREVSTAEIVIDALRRDKTVFIPYIHSSSESPKSKTMDMLRLKDEEDLLGLEPDAWGIPSLSDEGIELRENAMGGTGIFEPSSSSSSHEPRLDLVFMPGMAFDAANHRLGHGKGFYDKYLSRWRQFGLQNNSSFKRPTLIGLALREQVIVNGEEIPVNEFDWQIDQLVTAH